MVEEGEGEAVEHMLAELARWAAQTRADDTARGRSRERWLRQQAAEEATFIGVALDLAERRAGVAIGTANGRTVRGTLSAVARDFWLIDGDGVPTLVATPYVVSIRPLPGSDGGDATGDRTDVLGMRLVDALTAIAADRPTVRLAVVGDTEVVRGELRTVGADVLTVRPDGANRQPVYVALSGVIECSILGSG
jgi:hypothetical protein